MIFTAAVEGPSDEAALRKVVQSVGFDIGLVHGRNGKNQLLKNLNGYNHAARFEPWIVLLDLDRDPCAVAARNLWLPAPARFMCFRIAVRELEAWLLADRERFSEYFAVSIDHLPLAPDELPDAKTSLVNIVRRSRRAAVRLDMVPDQVLGQTIGPAYTARIIEFVSSDRGWRVDVAASRSPSLHRTVSAIRSMANEFAN